MRGVNDENLVNEENWVRDASMSRDGTTVTETEIDFHVLLRKCFWTPVTLRLSRDATREPMRQGRNAADMQ